METEETRELIGELIKAREERDREKVRALLSDDVEWIVPVGTPMTDLSGRDDVADGLTGAAAGDFFDPESIHREITLLLADGGKAAVRQHIRATTRAGEQYENHYCWFYLCEGGKIVKIYDYLDTLVASRVLGFDLEQQKSE